MVSEVCAFSIGGPGADSDGLDHREEAGVADGETTSHSKQIKHKFTSKIPQRMNSPAEKIRLTSYFLWYK